MTVLEEIRARTQRYLEACKGAEQLHKTLRADDPRFRGIVIMRHADGSQATWCFAFVHEGDDDMLLIHTEHHGWFVYPRDEVDVVATQGDLQQHWPMES